MAHSIESTIALPRRAGSPPRTTPSSPHLQTDQQGPPEIWMALADRVFALPAVRERPIPRAYPPERGIWLRDDLEPGPKDGFLQRREIGHFHPWDGSMHIAMPPALVEAAVSSGWAEVHPVAKVGNAPPNYLMLYSPREQAEADVLFLLTAAAISRAARDGAEPQALAVTARNPDDCTPGHDCGGHASEHQHGPHCGHEQIPHGDHVDYLVEGHLHHPHGAHCDDHGLVEAARTARA